MAWGDGAVRYVEEVRATKPGWWWPTTSARIQKRQYYNEEERPDMPKQAVPTAPCSSD
jgi:hypothetical protein